MTPQATLEDYAHRVGVSILSVGALKLRPTQEGASYVDTFGFNDGNAYLYDSEYRALREALAAAGWNSRRESHNREVYERDGIQWTLVQHESGPEILGTVEAITSIAAGLIAIFEFVRKQIVKNKDDEKSDRYYKDEVYKIRIESRRFRPDGSLEEILTVNAPIRDALPTAKAVAKIVEIMDKSRSFDAGSSSDNV